MKILTMGGDERNARLAELAAAAGIQARVGEEEQADVAVLPNLRILESAPYAYMAARLRPEAEIYIYASPAEACQSCGCGRRVINLLLDDAYVEENARLTAEGALVRAVERSGVALMAEKSVVLGYGRIGSALCRRLMAMESRVWVAARRADARQSAQAAGARAVDFSDLEAALDGANFIFNTVPAPILSMKELSLIPRRAILMDLASPPYGFDVEKARQMGLNAVRESGLPGKYCPHSGARAMLNAIRRIHESLQVESKGGELA